VSRIPKGGATASVRAREAPSGRVDRALHQRIPRNKKIEMRENSVNRYCGHRSKRRHPVYQGHQLNNRDMPEAHASLRQYLAEGSKVIQNGDSLSASTEPNESFLALNGNYPDKHLDFTDRVIQQYSFDKGLFHKLIGAGCRPSNPQCASLCTLVSSYSNVACGSLGFWL
jgi:hypothetical protein